MNHRCIFLITITITILLVAGGFSVGFFVRPAKVLYTAHIVPTTPTVITPVLASVDTPASPSLPTPILPTPLSVATRPLRLLISSIAARIPLIKVGLTSTGNLDVPHNFTQAGWYDQGPLPGELGSAVIDGHVDNGAAVSGVFKKLRDVKIGDDIAVDMDNGQTRHFMVIDTSIYKTEQFPGELVFHQTGQAYLKIITCHGTYVPTQHTYDKRLVVTAVLQPTTSVLSRL